MKKIFYALCAILTIGVNANAQNIIDQHFEKFKQKENVTSIHVSGKMFEIASKIEIEVEGEELKQLKDFASNIESFNMIVAEDVADLKTEYRNALSKVKNSHEELMRVNSKEGNFIFKVDEYNNVVRELILIGQTDKEFIAFSLLGQIQLDELGSMMNGIQKHGVESISKAFDSGLDEFKVYPNPISNKTRLKVDIPSEMLDGNLTINDLNGNELRNLNLSDSKMNIDLNQFSPGSYIVQLQKGETRLTKKFIVLQ